MGSLLTARGNASSLHVLLGQNKGRVGPLVSAVLWGKQGTAASKIPPPVSPEAVVDAPL